jgi:hypothetical protein
MKQVFSLFFCLIIAVFFNSCNIINPTEKTPYFLQIDSVQLQATNYSQHGEVSKKITDVWVYANNNLLGGFELPARIPILADSGAIIDIQAGVQRNGLSDDRLKYPFYKLANLSLNWKAGTTQMNNPVFTYVPFNQMKMYINEDFEVGNAFLPLTTDTSIISITNDTYGKKCGAIYLDNLHKQSQNIHQEQMDLLTAQQYYLELDYKSNVTIAVDVLCTAANGTSSIQSLGGVKPKETWNKVYFDVSALVNVVRTKSYRIIISAYKQDTQATGYALIDNVKIVGPR